MRLFSTSRIFAAGLVGLASLAMHAAQPTPIGFDWFEYSGKDKTLTATLKPGEYHNPILAGFYPDPSICRVGDDYYLVNSTFAYFPGLPIFHSKDLVNWTQIGNAIDRPNQLRYDGLNVSAGIFAPALSYHDGLFYLICTQVDSDGNFVVTAKNPAGPWSDPVMLDFGGIDPSIFFDDDGRAWIVNNDSPDEKPLYNGHRAIRIQEFDYKAMKVVGPRKVLVNGGVDISTKPIWIEGPHVIKRDGWYYLCAAEGGTGPGHSQVVLRSEKVTGPYVPWEKNPILTQRNLPPNVPGAVSCTGHASLVVGPDGKWWSVFLGVRPYHWESSPMGRETFLLPVDWPKDGWPTILPASERVPLFVKSPNGVTVKQNPELPLSGDFTWRDDFKSEKLSFAWIMLRAPSETWWKTDTTAGRLLLTPRKDTLYGKHNPSYLGRRVQHNIFDASLGFEVPAEGGVAAGMTVFQSDAYHYFVGVRREAGEPVVFLERVLKGERTVLATAKLPAVETISLRATANLDKCAFEYALKPGQWQTLAADLDAKMLTTARAGGFVGATVGPHVRIER